MSVFQRRFFLILGTAAILFTSMPAPSATKSVPLIPRETLFGNPDKAGAQISPDGKRISFIAPVNGVLNLWVAPADQPSRAKAVTNDRNRGITTYFWSFNPRYLLYSRDKNGDENTHIYRLDLTNNTVKDLTPGTGFQARIQEVSRFFPNDILVAMNKRNPQLHDVFRVNLQTGDTKSVFQNDQYIGVMTDDAYKVRYGLAFRPDFTIAVEDLTVRPRKTVLSIGNEDMMTTNPVAFNKDRNWMFMLDSRGRDKTALVKMNTITGQSVVIAEGKNADISGVLIHPTERTVQAVAEEYTRQTWRILDKSIQRDMDYLRGLSEGDLNVADRSRDDSRWIVTYVRDNGPVSTWLYDRKARKARRLFVNRQALVGLPLARMNPVVVKSRDGMNLVCYLSLPPASDPDGNVRPDKPLPTVLWIHGGPWARDSWGYDSVHQFLANRGYAVMSINYRGSTGFGKRFLNAANKEWGGKMHTDLLDAVDWIVNRKIADPKRIAITGGSYGGYATLVGMTFTPDRFACGVDIFGPSNLVTWMQNVPPYWMPVLPMIKDRVGDVSTEEGRAFLESRSPITKVDQIRRPLLIAQGANDPRVVQSESDQIVDAMRAKNIPVTYIVYPDEGHGLERPQNRLSFFAIMEQFLAKHLGGRAEPIGKALKGSSLQVKEGTDFVPGLKQAPR